MAETFLISKNKFELAQGCNPVPALITTSMKETAMAKYPLKLKSWFASAY